MVKKPLPRTLLHQEQSFILPLPFCPPHQQQETEGTTVAAAGTKAMATLQEEGNWGFTLKKTNNSSTVWCTFGQTATHYEFRPCG